MAQWPPRLAALLLALLFLLSSLGAPLTAGQVDCDLALLLVQDNSLSLAEQDQGKLRQRIDRFLVRYLTTVTQAAPDYQIWAGLLTFANEPQEVVAVKPLAEWDAADFAAIVAVEEGNKTDFEATLEQAEVSLDQAGVLDSVGCRPVILLVSDGGLDRNPQLLLDSNYARNSVAPVVTRLQAAGIPIHFLAINPLESQIDLWETLIPVAARYQTEATLSPGLYEELLANLLPADLRRTLPLQQVINELELPISVRPYRQAVTVTFMTENLTVTPTHPDVWQREEEGLPDGQVRFTLLPEAERGELGFVLRGSGLFSYWVEAPPVMVRIVPELTQSSGLLLVQARLESQPPEPLLGMAAAGVIDDPDFELSAKLVGQSQLYPLALVDGHYEALLSGVNEAGSQLLLTVSSSVADIRPAPVQLGLSQPLLDQIELAAVPGEPFAGEPLAICARPLGAELPQAVVRVGEQIKNLVASDSSDCPLISVFASGLTPGSYPLAIGLPVGEGYFFEEAGELNVLTAAEPELRLSHDPLQPRAEEEVTLQITLSELQPRAEVGEPLLIVRRDGQNLAAVGPEVMETEAEQRLWLYRLPGDQATMGAYEAMAQVVVNYPNSETFTVTNDLSFTIVPAGPIVSFWWLPPVAGGLLLVAVIAAIYGVRQRNEKLGKEKGLEEAKEKVTQVKDEANRLQGKIAELEQEEQEQHDVIERLEVENQELAEDLRKEQQRLSSIRTLERVKREFDDVYATGSNETGIFEKFQVFLDLVHSAWKEVDQLISQYSLEGWDKILLKFGLSAQVQSLLVKVLKSKELDELGPPLQALLKWLREKDGANDGDTIRILYQLLEQGASREILRAVGEQGNAPLNRLCVSLYQIGQSHNSINLYSVLMLTAGNGFGDAGKNLHTFYRKMDGIRHLDFSKVGLIQGENNREWMVPQLENLAKEVGQQIVTVDLGNAREFRDFVKHLTKYIRIEERKNNNIPELRWLSRQMEFWKHQFVNDDINQSDDQNMVVKPIVRPSLDLLEYEEKWRENRSEPGWDFALWTAVYNPSRTTTSQVTKLELLRWAKTRPEEEVIESTEIGPLLPGNLSLRRFEFKTDSSGKYFLRLDGQIQNSWSLSLTSSESVLRPRNDQRLLPAEALEGNEELWKSDFIEASHETALKIKHFLEEANDFQPRLIQLRGLSGSGRTSIVNHLQFILDTPRYLPVYISLEQNIEGAEKAYYGLLSHVFRQLREFAKKSRDLKESLLPILPRDKQLPDEDHLGRLDEFLRNEDYKLLLILDDTEELRDLTRGKNGTLRTLAKNLPALVAFKSIFLLVVHDRAVTPWEKEFYDQLGVNHHMTFYSDLLDKDKAQTLINWPVGDDMPGVARPFYTDMAWQVAYYFTAGHQVLLNVLCREFYRWEFGIGGEAGPKASLITAQNVKQMISRILRKNSPVIERFWNKGFDRCERSTLWVLANKGFVDLRTGWLIDTYRSPSREPKWSRVGEMGFLLHQEFPKAYEQIEEGDLEEELRDALERLLEKQVLVLEDDNLGQPARVRWHIGWLYHQARAMKAETIFDGGDQEW